MAASPIAKGTGSTHKTRRVNLLEEGAYDNSLGNGRRIRKPLDNDFLYYGSAGASGKTMHWLNCWHFIHQVIHSFVHLCSQSLISHSLVHPLMHSLTSLLIHEVMYLCVHSCVCDSFVHACMHAFILSFRMQTRQAQKPQLGTCSSNVLLAVSLLFD